MSDPLVGYAHDTNDQCGTSNHHPHNCYCPDDDNCCMWGGPLSRRCHICGDEWPCPTKREHVEQRRARADAEEGK